MEACEFGKGRRNSRNYRRFVVQLAPSLYPSIWHTGGMNKMPKRKQERLTQKIRPDVMCSINRQQFLKVWKKEKLRMMSAFRKIPIKVQGW